MKQFLRLHFEGLDELIIPAIHKILRVLHIPDLFYFFYKDVGPAKFKKMEHRSILFIYLRCEKRQVLCMKWFFLFHFHFLICSDEINEYVWECGEWYSVAECKTPLVLLFIFFSRITMSSTHSQACFGFLWRHLKFYELRKNSPNNHVFLLDVL